MKVQLLYFAGCPHEPEARVVLGRALEAAGLPTTFEAIDVGAADASETLLRWGSPTILVDGVDVGGQTEGSGPTCRLYESSEGAPRGCPSERAILDALRAARQRPEASTGIDGGSQSCR